MIKMRDGKKSFQKIDSSKYMVVSYIFSWWGKPWYNPQQFTLKQTKWNPPSCANHHPVIRPPNRNRRDVANMVIDVAEFVRFFFGGVQNLLTFPILKITIYLYTPPLKLNSSPFQKWERTGRRIPFLFSGPANFQWLCQSNFHGHPWTIFDFSGKFGEVSKPILRIHEWGSTRGFLRRRPTPTEFKHSPFQPIIFQRLC